MPLGAAIRTAAGAVGAVQEAGEWVGQVRGVVAEGLFRAGSGSPIFHTMGRLPEMPHADVGVVDPHSTAQLCAIKQGSCTTNQLVPSSVSRSRGKIWNRCIRNRRAGEVGVLIHNLTVPTDLHRAPGCRGRR